MALRLTPLALQLLLTVVMSSYGVQVETVVQDTAPAAPTLDPACASVHEAMLTTSKTGRSLLVRDYHPGIGLGHVLEVRAIAALVALAVQRSIVFEHCQDETAPWERGQDLGVPGCKQRGLPVVGTEEPLLVGRVPRDVSTDYSPVYGPTLADLRSADAVYPPPGTPRAIDGRSNNSWELLAGADSVVVMETIDTGRLEEYLNAPAPKEFIRGLFDKHLKGTATSASVPADFLSEMKCCALKAVQWAPSRRLERRVSEFLRRNSLKFPPPVSAHLRTFDLDWEKCRLAAGSVHSWSQVDAAMKKCSAPEELGGYGRASMLRGIALSAFVNATVNLARHHPIHVSTDSEEVYNWLSARGTAQGLVTSGEPFTYPTTQIFYTFADVVDMHLMSHARYILAPSISSFSSIAACLSHSQTPPKLLTNLEEINEEDADKIAMLYQAVRA
ncbi:hypothetical protein CYMTET_17198 [Cymbomonas tetramitiformis]|uniref:Uncharacterized protein n=1 Tax=Cymbomonas tetramitiformis TaxID=36881 RepID=A0AAE0GAM7_9CHLO|nr:hypothetical protein CYMTET_17198 [Cymbomonas tetramitiformis]